MHMVLHHRSPGLATLALVLIGLIQLSPDAVSSSLSPQHIDSLYSDADFVGYVQIVASESRWRERGKRTEGAIITKGRIELALRGDSTEFIYFGGFSGNALGETYLLFLKRSGKTVEQRLHRLHDQGNPRFDTETSPYYLIMFEGFGSMETGHSYTLELPHLSSWERWKSGRGVRVATSHVLIPTSLRAASITTTDDSVWSIKWVARQELTDYLLQLRSRITPAGNRSSRPQWIRACFDDHDLKYGRIGDSATAASIDAELRPQFRILFGEAFEQRLEQTKVATFDSSFIRKYREHWKGPEKIRIVQYAGGPASGFVSVCLLLGTTLTGRVLDEEGERDIGTSPLLSLARLREIIMGENPPDGPISAELSNVTSRGPVIWRVIIPSDEITFKETIFLVNARTGEVIDAYDSIQAYHIW